MESVLEFRGRDARGAGVTGTLQNISAADLVERKFKARWTRLRVEAGDGRLVGAIDRDIEGRRIWWAEVVD